jgi:hypothetical protein
VKGDGGRMQHHNGNAAGPCREAQVAPRSPAVCALGQAYEGRHREPSAFIGHTLHTLARAHGRAGSVHSSTARVPQRSMRLASCLPSSLHTRHLQTPFCAARTAADVAAGGSALHMVLLLALLLLYYEHSCCSHLCRTASAGSCAHTKESTIACFCVCVGAAPSCSAHAPPSHCARPICKPATTSCTSGARHYTLLCGDLLVCYSILRPIAPLLLCPIRFAEPSV